MTEITEYEAIEIIEGSNLRGLGQFYAKSGTKWIGIDNSDGDAWVEEFDSFEELEKWMKGED